MTITVCSPQTMPKYDYNTVEDNNLQTSVPLKSGRCLKLSDKIGRNMPNFLSISLTINKNSVQIMLPVVFAVFLLRFKAITVDKDCL